MKPERLRKGGGLFDRDDDLEVGARLLGRRCKDIVGGCVIAEPDTPSFSITEADVGHVFVGEQNSANVARFDPSQKSVFWSQDVLLGRLRRDYYGRRVSLDGGRFVASLATQEAENGYSDEGRASPHHFVRRRRAADCSARSDAGTLAEGPRRVRRGRSRRRFEAALTPLAAREKNLGSVRKHAGFLSARSLSYARRRPSASIRC
jgi:hypothetical protein